MADFNPIQFKRIITTKTRPTAANLKEGELALNLADGRIYTLTDGNVVKSLSDFKHGGSITANYNYNNIKTPGFYYDLNAATSLNSPSTENSGTGYLLVYGHMDNANESNTVVTVSKTILCQMYIGSTSGYCWTRMSDNNGTNWTTWTRPVYNGDAIALGDTLSLKASNNATGLSIVFKNTSDAVIGSIKYVEATGLVFNAGTNVATFSKTDGSLTISGGFFEGGNRVYSPNNIPSTSTIWATDKIIPSTNANNIGVGQFYIDNTSSGFTNFPTLQQTNYIGYFVCRIIDKTGFYQEYYNYAENIVYTRSYRTTGGWTTWVRLVNMDTSELNSVTKLSASTLAITSALTVSGNTTITGTIALNNTVNVGGAANFNNITTFNNNVNLSGTSRGILKANVGNTVDISMLIGGVTGTNDLGYIGVGATAENAGFLEIGTTDDGSEPIYARQRKQGTYGNGPAGSTIVRTFTILSEVGDTFAPGNINSEKGFILNVSSGTGVCGLTNGTGDNATYALYNMAVKSNYGVGFVDTSGSTEVCNLVIDNRTGNLLTKGNITASTLNTTSIANSGTITTSILNASDISATGAINSNGIITIRNSSQTSGIGISLFNTTTAANSLPSYGLAFAGTAAFGSHGFIATNDWSTYFTITGSVNRGWIFKNGANNVASIRADGLVSADKGYTIKDPQGNYTNQYGLYAGNGDGAAYDKVNMIIRSHWGIGFQGMAGTNTIVFDTRTGNINTVGNVVMATLQSTGITATGNISTTGNLSANDITVTTKVVAPSFEGNLKGNADTATKLQTARAINDVNFDGTSNITINQLKGINDYAAPTDGNLYGDNAMSMGGVYNNGYPSAYGNVINLKGKGFGQIVAEWTGGTATGRLYYRSARDSTKVWGTWKTVAYLDDNVASATKLQNTRNIALTGAVTGNINFDGTSNVNIATTLADSGVVSGVYGDNIRIPVITINSNGTISSASSSFIRNASTTVKGVVQLNDTVNSNSTDLAATANSVKQVYDYVINSGLGVTTSDYTLPVFSNGTSSITDEYLVLVPYTPRVNYYVMGSFRMSKGTDTATNRGRHSVLTVNTGNGSTKFSLVDMGIDSDQSWSYFSLLTIDGVDYLALRSLTTGGSDSSISIFSGSASGDAKLFTRVRSSASNVTVKTENLKNIERIAINSDVVTLDNNKFDKTGGAISGPISVSGNIDASSNIVIGKYLFARGGSDIGTAQGAWVGWNKQSGQGRTDFVNNRGQGAGGWDFWNGNDSSTTLIASIDANGNYSKNAATATKLQTARNIAVAGDVVGNVNFDGTSNVIINTAIRSTIITDNTGAWKNSFRTSLGANTTGSFISAYRTNYNDIISVGHGANLAWGASDTHSFINVSYDNSNAVFIGAGNSNTIKWSRQVAFVDSNVASATKLNTARNINGVAFDGTSDITIVDDTKVYLSSKLPKTSGARDIVQYYNLASLQIDVSSSAFTGMIQIAFSSTIRNQMMNLDIMGYHYTSTTGAWSLMFGGYNSTSTSNWSNYSATVAGIAPFNRIRVGKSSSNTDVLILGDTDTVWNHTSIAIVRAIVAWNNTNNFTPTISQITSLTGYTALADVPIYGTPMAQTALKLTNSRNINGVAFDGTSDITIADSTKLPLTGGTITGVVNINADVNINPFGSLPFTFTSNTNGNYIALGNVSKGVIRTYGLNGYQMTLGAGGIDASGEVRATSLTSTGTLSVSGAATFSNNITTSGSILANTDNTIVLVGNDQDLALVKKQGTKAFIGIGNNTSFVVSRSNAATVAVANTYSELFRIDGNGRATLTNTLQITNTIGTLNLGYFGTSGSALQLLDATATETMALRSFADGNGYQFSLLKGGLVANGNANITGAVTVGSALTVTGGTVLNSTLDVNAKITTTDAIQVTMPDTANAFKQLIFAKTTTDGGYIAVGNEGSDKGYVEIGTVDDTGTAIYARKRNTGLNTVYPNSEVKLLGFDNTSSFPVSVTAPKFIGDLTGTSDYTQLLRITNTSNGVDNIPTGRLAESIFDVKKVYLNNFPKSYGNVLNIGGDGQTQMFIPWGGTTAFAPIIRSRSDVATGWGEWNTLAFITDNVASATRLADSDSFSSSSSTSWYRMGTATIPQNGRTVIFRLYGGAGYNGNPQQSTDNTIIVKTGNNAPYNATITLDSTDEGTSPLNVALNSLGNNNFEVFVQLGGFSAYYYTVEKSDECGWNKNAAYMDLPSTAVIGYVRIVANLTSNVASATKLKNARTISFTGITATSRTFDGTGDISIPVTAVPTTLLTGYLQSSTIVSTFNINNTGADGQSQLPLLSVVDLGTTAGTTINPTNVPAIMARLNAARVVGFTTDGNGYLWGYRSHNGASTYTWNSKVKLAEKWTSPITVSVTGNLTGSVSFDGSVNATLALNAGTAATRDIGTSGATVPLLNASNTFSGTTVFSGSMINLGTAVASPFKTRGIMGITEDNSSLSDLYLNYSQGGKVFFGGATHSISSDGSSYTGNSATATKLQTSRTIWGKSFDGSGNIGGDIIVDTGFIRSDDANHYIDIGKNKSDRINFGSYGGVFNFVDSNGATVGVTITKNNIVTNGGTITTADVKATGWMYSSRYVSATGDSSPAEFVGNLTGNAGSATVLQTGRSISLSGDVNGSVTFDGSGNVNIDTTVRGTVIPSASSGTWMNTLRSSLGVASNGSFISTFRTPFDSVVSSTHGANFAWGCADTHGFITTPYQGGDTYIGAGNAGKIVWYKRLAYADSNVASATKLNTARAINGVNFDGTSNITIYDNTKVPFNAAPTSQGAYMSWNKQSGQGRTDFVNHRGNGGGGFDFWNGNENGYTKFASIDATGKIWANGGFGGDLNGNADSANKLNNARTLWGQSFDGTGDVNGEFTSNGNIKLTGEDRMIAVGINQDIALVKKSGMGGKVAIGANNSFTVMKSNKASISVFDTFTDLFSVSNAGVVSTTNDIIVSTGVLKADNNHYIDVGKSGTDRINFATYGGVFNFIDTNTGITGTTINKGLVSTTGDFKTTAWVYANKYVSVNGEGTPAIFVGNASTATKLQTARNINGVAFDGTSDINTFPNNTLIPIGDDVKMGDGNASGCLVIQTTTTNGPGIEFRNLNGTVNMRIRDNWFSGTAENAKNADTATVATRLASGVTPVATWSGAVFPNGDTTYITGYFTVQNGETLSCVVSLPAGVSNYITPGRTKLYIAKNGGNDATPVSVLVTAFTVSSRDTGINSNMKNETISFTISWPAHGYSGNVYLQVAAAAFYESNCSFAGRPMAGTSYMNYTYLLNLYNPVTVVGMPATITASSDVYNWNSSRGMWIISDSQPQSCGIAPYGRDKMQFIVGDNNTDVSQRTSYVSIVVYDGV